MNFPYAKESKIKAFKWQLLLLRGGELQPGASKEVTERGEVMTREDEEEYFGEGRVKGRGI